MSCKFEAQRYDTIIVGSMPGIPTAALDLVARLRLALTEFRRVASICTGAFILDAAGAFEGREVTTHWGYTDELVNRLPGAKVVPDRMFVREGHVWSSAGMTAGTDLILSMVEADVGHHVAQMICKMMVLSHRRPDCQSQFSVLGKAIEKLRVDAAKISSRSVTRRPHASRCKLASAVRQECGARSCGN